MRKAADQSNSQSESEPHLGREEVLIRESVTDNFWIVLYVYFLRLALSVML